MTKKHVLALAMAASLFSVSPAYATVPEEALPAEEAQDMQLPENEAGGEAPGMGESPSGEPVEEPPGDPAEPEPGEEPESGEESIGDAGEETPEPGDGEAPAEPIAGEDSEKPEAGDEIREQEILYEIVTETPVIKVLGEKEIYSPEDSVTVEITAPEDFEIYYTLDGSDPLEAGILYTEPITLTASMSTENEIVLKAIAKKLVPAEPEAVPEAGLSEENPPEEQEEPLPEDAAEAPEDEAEVPGDTNEIIEEENETPEGHEDNEAEESQEVPGDEISEDAGAGNEAEASDGTGGEENGEN